MEKPENRSFKKIAKKTAIIFAWIFASITTIILALALYVYLSQDKIKAYLIDEINKHLLTEISVEQIDVTFISSFPYVTLVFENVVIPEVVNGVQGDNVLIKATRVELQFNVWDVIRGRYLLRRLNVKDAACHMKVLPDGETNYMFWKTDTVSTDDSDFQLWLSRVRFDNVKCTYDNKQNDVYINILAHNFKMSGAFYEKNFDMAFKGDFLCHEINASGNKLLANMNMTASGKMKADTENSMYEFQDAVLNFEKVKLYISGNYINSTIPYIDIHAKNEKCKLADLESLLPENFSKHLQDFNKKGTVEVKAHLKGYVSKENMPALELDMKLSGGSLTNKETGVELQELNFEATYLCANLKSPEKASVHCKQFSAVLESGYLKGEFALHGFTQSEVSLKLDAELELNDLHRFFKFDEVEHLKGRVKLELDFSNTFTDISDMKIADFLNAQSTGTLVSERIDMKLKSYSEEISVLQLNARFNQKDLNISSMQLKTCGSDMTISGVAYNIFPFLLLENQLLHIEGDGKSNIIYVDRLFLANIPPDNANSKGAYIDLPENIRLDVSLSVRELYYDTFSAKDVKAKAILNKKLLLLRDMSFTSMEGRVTAEVIIDARNEKDFDFRVMAELKGVNISQAFKDFNNFGQSSLTNENLKGKLSGNVHFSSKWSKDLKIDMNSLTVVSDIEISNGAIKNYEPLAGLRKYFKRRDFSNVEFATLQNQIIIKEKEIIIPQMLIKSNVMDFEMQGKHYFDNKINYNFKIQFAELLKNQNKNQKTSAEEEYGSIKDDNDNKLTWHFKVTGTVDNPKFVPLDLQSVTTKVKEDFKEEGKTAIKILQQEFGNKKDSANIIPQHKEGDKPKIIIEWDDD